MLCWEASISLPGKHPSRLKWQAKACKNLLLTPFSQVQSKSPGSSPSPTASCHTAAWQSCRSLTQEREKGTAPLPRGPEEIRPNPTAVDTLLPISSSLSSQFPWFIPSEKQRITCLGHIKQLCSGMLQVPGTDGAWPGTDVPSCRARHFYSKGITNSRTMAWVTAAQLQSLAMQQVPPPTSYK